MLHFFARRLKELHEKDNEEGFTLLEILVVVIIIGILTAIAIPTFLNQRRNGLEAQAQADIRNAVTNAESDAAGSNGSYANVTLADIQQGISTDNTTLALSGVSATNYCIQGTNTTNPARSNSST